MFDSDLPAKINETSVVSGRALDKDTPCLCPGDEISGYRVIEHLGDGGMAEVFLVENIQMGKRYAMKVISSNVQERDGFVNRFRTEARVMAEMDHPNIVKVHHAQDSDGFFMVLMDYVSGPAGTTLTLEHLLELEGKLDQAYTASLLIQICDALDHAHNFPAGEIIHRDLKPSNILIDSKGQARIADFGLAKVVGQEVINSLIQDSLHLEHPDEIDSTGELLPAEIKEKGNAESAVLALIGTYEYMSPELQEGKSASVSSDLYSLGLILYRCLSGKNPKGNWKSPSQLGLNPCWDPIVSKLLEPEPEDRYSSALELRRDLELVRAECNAAVNPLSDIWIKRKVKHASAPFLSRPKLSAGALLLVLCLGAFLIYHSSVQANIPEVAAPPPLKAGKNWHIPSLNLKLIYVDPGTFMMGSVKAEGNELPQHPVTITRGFWIGQFELTQDQYTKLAGTNPSHFKGPKLPVESVSWFDAMKFCQILTAKEREAQHIPVGYEFRLPTEAEWEYAARGGSAFSDTRFSGSDNPDRVAWYDINSGRRTREIGKKAPNSLGIYDMSGNVNEWCLDSFSETRKTGKGNATEAIKDPLVKDGSKKVNRGGCWYFISDSCTTDMRFPDDPLSRLRRTGFRVVLVNNIRKK